MENVLSFTEVRENAKGRWFGIMAALGISVGDGRHTACPLCGPGNNSHRFRFSENDDGNGMWICTQCGGGDAISLVQQVFKCDIKEAFEAVSKVTGIAHLSIPKERKASPEEFRRLLKGSYKVRKGDPVDKYLKNRGLSDIPFNIFYCPKCYELETRKHQKAMLAIFSAPDGEALTIHRTYVKDGKKLDIKSPKKIMTPLKPMAGGAVRLYNGKPEVLGVCEGIETAMAVHELYKIEVWPCLSAILLEKFEPPDWVHTVNIYADNDYTYTGHRAAYTLANRLVVKNQLKAEVFVSKNGDFLDDLNERGAHV